MCENTCEDLGILNFTPYQLLDAKDGSSKVGSPCTKVALEAMTVTAIRNGKYLLQVEYDLIRE